MDMVDLNENEAYLCLVVSSCYESAVDRVIIELSRSRSDIISESKTTFHTKANHIITKPLLECLSLVTTSNLKNE